MNKLEQKIYNYYVRHGYKEKFAHAGVYCIKLDDNIVYIGKSYNMLVRLSQHFIATRLGSKETKYIILAQAYKKGHKIEMDVLYDAKCINFDQMKEEIGQKEGEYIRLYRPILNTQIPKVNDWRKFDVQKIDKDAILEKL